MPHAVRERADHAALNTQVRDITEKLEEFVLKEDWEAIKSVIRVLNAHSRANELRAQGQSARAHLWLVGVGRKGQQQKPTKKPNAPLPAV